MAGVPSCSCGVFAIGSCTACGKHVCGSHGALVNDAFLCLEHAEKSRAAEARRAEEAAQANAAAPEATQPDPAIAGMFDEFRQQMRSQPTIAIADPDSKIVTRKRLLRVPLFEHQRVLAHGWYVVTPHHPGAVTHVDTSAAETATSSVLGLAVASDGSLFGATAPGETQMLAYKRITPSVAEVGLHTHGRSLRPSRAESAAVRASVIEALRALLDAAVVRSATAAPPRTKREERRREKEYLRQRDERIYGPGGRKEYDKRGGRTLGL